MSPIANGVGHPPAAGNQLLDYLPRQQREAVLANCDPINLVFGTVLCDVGQPFSHVYFPVSGSISLLRTVHGHEPFATENIGCEGMLGATLVLGINQAPQRAVVHAAGLALRIESERIREAMVRFPALQTVLQRYLYLVLNELSQSAGCVRFHDVGSRLARALLLAHDRVSADDLPVLTHRLLADMLGVQRGSVTIAAAKLQRRGIIRYSRGRIAILDRAGLEAVACGCYRAGIENYQAMFPRYASECVPDKA
ncbi:Crp/Fnr family transcriptional regulator [Chromatocurvus halotolerans]|uniref:CRP-like cAMP-binding protein n=1 Tax=Chromatocurvus halotolerans TaxID=1132028 RepID=A0A4R2KTR2_9GAMM|nr:Crp/Fnr family transcriptional regulator [Chromatocurvus halotolerans]TCO74479.1 CRP-like cAMP-binding protein [Chromatocurvus halotolerans]